MLNLTKTIEYALISIRHINNNGDEKLYSAKEISTIYHIPNEHLAKILQKLTKLGYLKSVKGVKGGYALNKNLSNINLIDFMESLEGPIGLVKCSTNLDCELLELCNIKDPINRINNNIRESLGQLSLYEITV
jgi:Rrf2 family protein